jgi:hypothetical protein
LHDAPEKLTHLVEIRTHTHDNKSNVEVMTMAIALRHEEENFYYRMKKASGERMQLASVNPKIIFLEHKRKTSTIG